MAVVKSLIMRQCEKGCVSTSRQQDEFQIGRRLRRNQRQALRATPRRSLAQATRFYESRPKEIAAVIEKAAEADSK